MITKTDLKKLNRLACLRCGTRWDEFDEHGNKDLELDGAYMLCEDCGEMSMLQACNGSFTVRPATDDEIIQLPASVLQHMARLQRRSRR